MPIIANLLELFCNTGKGHHPTICNFYGSKRTGRKTIANYFGHLMVIKQLFQRVVVKVVSSTDSISGIIRKETEKSRDEGTPFFIFSFSESYNSKSSLRISEGVFGDTGKEGVNAILIT